MLSDILKKHSNELLRPLGIFMGRIGIRPNNLTFLGLALTMAAAWQLHAAAILPGVVLLLLAGLADGGDGLLARSAGQTSVRGGFLDALTDRYSDSLLFGALLLGGWLAPLPPGIPGEAWALAALIGALLTSYARAAAERLGVSQQAAGAHHPAGTRPCGGRTGRRPGALGDRHAGAAGTTGESHGGAAAGPFLAERVGSMIYIGVVSRK